ncbi:MAG: hypothetical protein K2K43_01570, partial [Alistipes sp.]|nr:hypothetical protein [Alistipes sp.]
AVNRTAEDLDIEIAGFKLDRVHTDATMTWAKGNTTANFITDLDDIFQEGGNNPDDFCSWDIDYNQPTGAYLNYHSIGNVKPGTAGDDDRLTIKLTDEVQDLTGYEWAEGMTLKPWFVIPQKFIPWNGNLSDKTGTRLMVLVKIKPINHPEKDKYGDYVVQHIDGEEIYSKYKGTTDKDGNTIFAWAAVAPVSRTKGQTEDGELCYEWQQNRKYVYTLIFDGFNSGLVPDPSDDPKDPDPTDPDPDKDPIVDVNRQADEFVFEITVDEYDADNEDVEMPGKPQGSIGILS